MSALVSMHPFEGLHVGDLVSVSSLRGAAMACSNVLARVSTIHPAGAMRVIHVTLASGEGMFASPDFYRVRKLEISDPTGLSTGRWRVRRKVFVTRGGRAVQWAWRVAPEPARGVSEDVVMQELGYHDFPPRQFGRAVDEAVERARGNLR
ncbi:hypothetical protein [Microbacterium halotolerans]|uniref:hypothetical protein n=1 Tax=Microbacterium halotolerans TaxID=246613 RepID=UPI0013C2D7C4|nr:hypothetical protein [Microbacterium halotolerans]